MMKLGEKIEFDEVTAHDLCPRDVYWDRERFPHIPDLGQDPCCSGSVALVLGVPEITHNRGESAFVIIGYESGIQPDHKMKWKSLADHLWSPDVEIDDPRLLSDHLKNPKMVYINHRGYMVVEDEDRTRYGISLYTLCAFGRDGYLEMVDRLSEKFYEPNLEDGTNGP